MHVAEAGCGDSSWHSLTAFQSAQEENQKVVNFCRALSPSAQEANARCLDACSSALTARGWPEHLQMADADITSVTSALSLFRPRGPLQHVDKVWQGRCNCLTHFMLADTTGAVSLFWNSRASHMCTAFEASGHQRTSPLVLMASGNHPTHVTYPEEMLTMESNPDRSCHQPFFDARDWHDSQA